MATHRLLSSGGSGSSLDSPGPALPPKQTRAPSIMHHTYTYVHKRAHTAVHTHIHVGAQVHACTHTYMCARVYTYVHVCEQMYIYKCTHVCM